MSAEGKAVVHRVVTATVSRWGFSYNQIARKQNRGLSLRCVLNFLIGLMLMFQLAIPLRPLAKAASPHTFCFFPTQDQSHLCMACWYNSKSKVWLADVIKLSNRKKSTACFFISMEQTITQLESKQCRWNISKLFKSSHALVARLQLLPLRSVRTDWTHKVKKSLCFYQHCLTHCKEGEQL